MRVLATTLAALCLAGSATADILDDFEDGSMSEYLIGSGTFNNANISGAHAHDGALGLGFLQGSGPMFYYRNDVTTSAGNRYFAYVRSNVGSAGGAAAGRVYMGVDAGPGGAITAVFAPNTPATGLLLQNNSGWGFVTVGQVAANYAANTWYLLELNWVGVGQMQARVWDETGNTLIADTGVLGVPSLGGGGLALRGFTTGTAALNSIDTIYENAIPAPSVLALLGLAGLSIRGRRRQ
ncbi:MAG: hypothetical protein HRU76_12505 [Phycisphaeraceae bacterium]|nr:hypothetical protein [Phycisphaerales bacterium]QOJ18359.1 MAG: hypothetical protein HRU76_12505 [Phycisphaeraceae bacterium]